MRNALPLLLCLAISIFGVARATKAAHLFVPNVDAKASVSALNSEEGTDPDDPDALDGTSNGNDENTIDDNGGDAAPNDDTGVDDGADDGQDDDDDGNQAQ
jgi:hypothetical protein